MHPFVWAVHIITSLSSTNTAAAAQEGPRNLLSVGLPSSVDAYCYKTASDTKAEYFLRNDGSVGFWSAGRFPGLPISQAQAAWASQSGALEIARNRVFRRGLPAWGSPSSLQSGPQKQPCPCRPSLACSSPPSHPDAGSANSLLVFTRGSFHSTVNTFSPVPSL